MLKGMTKPLTRRRGRSVLFGLLLGVSALGTEPTRGAPQPRLDPFNYIVGTQTIGSRYQFTDQTRLVETAQAILGMGSNLIKFKLGPDYEAQHYTAGRRDDVHSLAELAEREPSVRAVLDMPFAHVILWAYAFNGGWWGDGYTDDEAGREYREIRQLAEYLLKRYDGSGKTFLLGHWEGDWYLHPDYNAGAEPSAEKVQAMIRWLNNRQRAVDDAKRAVPHNDVQVFHYTEVNLVNKALEGKKCLTNDVLPHTAVDYVSYSAYDVTVPNRGRSRALLQRALDHIESKLPAKPGIPGKRVFVGEFGFPLELTKTPEQQDAFSREVILAALEWGCPYVLYWQLYCNEVQDGQHRGFWLIDTEGRKQPFHQTLQCFYRDARAANRQFQERRGRLPDSGEFADWAREYLAANDARGPLRSDVTP